MNLFLHQMRNIRLQKLINLFVVLGGLVFVGTSYGRQGLGEQPVREVAERLIAQSGLEAGMVLHIGSGDGRLTGALYGSGQFVVQGLDLDGIHSGLGLAKLDPFQDHPFSRGVEFDHVG